VARFYEELFDRYPAVIPIFENVDLAKQEKMLLTALKMVVNSLHKPKALTKVLTGLGKRHQSYGAEPAHYQAVTSTLLDVMEEFAGELWTKEVQHNLYK